MKMIERDIQRALFWRHRSNAQIMLPNYTPPGWCECDTFHVTNAGYGVECEIKVTLGDFKADFRKTGKHRVLSGAQDSLRPDNRFCKYPPCRPSRFFYAVPERLVSLCDVPDYAGLIYLRFADGWSYPRLTIVRSAPRLVGEKVPTSVIETMRQHTYHRFWMERFRLDDYRAEQRR